MGEAKKEYGWDVFKYGTMVCSKCGLMEPGSVPEANANLMGHESGCPRGHLTHYPGKQEVKP